jgi:hypothetical protein
MRRRSLTTHVMDLSGSVYGTILASSIVAALSYKERGNAWVMIGALVATELVFALAHAVSTLFSGGRVHGRLPAAADVRGALRYEWPVLQAAWPAMILLLLAGVGLLGLDTAVNLALVANASILFVWGFALARLQGLVAHAAVAVGALSSGLGVALVMLKLALH